MAKIYLLSRFEQSLIFEVFLFVSKYWVIIEICIYYSWLVDVSITWTDWVLLFCLHFFKHKCQKRSVNFLIYLLPGIVSRSSKSCSHQRCKSQYACRVRSHLFICISIHSHSQTQTLLSCSKILEIQEWEWEFSRMRSRLATLLFTPKN